MAVADSVLTARAALIGERLAAQRLARNRTQRQLAKSAGVSLNTLRRLEAGENASLNTLIRVLEALGLGDRLDALIPPADIRPIERVRRTGGRERQRASGERASGDSRQPPATPWSWGDDQ